MSWRISSTIVMNNTKQYETIRKIYEINTNRYPKIWKTCETEILFSKLFVLLTIPNSLLGLLAHRPPIRLVLCTQPLRIAYRHWPCSCQVGVPAGDCRNPKYFRVCVLRLKSHRGRMIRSLPFERCVDDYQVALFFETLLVVDSFQDMLHSWMMGTEPRACRKNSGSWSQH